MAYGPRISGRALATLLPDLHDGAGLKYGVLLGAIRALILDGRVAIGTRLPSERELAIATGLSRTTVTTAYDGLRQGGYLASRAGSGSFVELPERPSERRSVDDWPAPRRPHVDQIDLTIAALPAPAGVVVDALALAASELPAHVYGSGGYDAMGLISLREAVARRFDARGVATDPEQIIITNGAQHGLDLLLRLLVGPGDRVLTELPTYAAALDAIRASAGRLLPVPVPLGGGWDLTQMTAVLRQSAPKLAYLIPDFQNPVGALVSDSAREQIIAVARQTSTMVVVDETFLGLGFVPQATPAAAIDPAVVTIGSLSKSVWGGLRIGWIRGSAELVQRLAAMRAAIDLGSPVIDQLVATELIGQLDRIISDRVVELARKRDVLVRGLTSMLPEWKLNDPDGGLTLWIELDAPLSTSLTLLARPAGVSIVPGSRFGVDGTLERFLRLPFSAPPDLLTEAVRRLAGVWHGMDRGAKAPSQLLVA